MDVAPPVDGAGLWTAHADSDEFLDIFQLVLTPTSHLGLGYTATCPQNAGKIGLTPPPKQKRVNAIHNNLTKVCESFFGSEIFFE